MRLVEKAYDIILEAEAEELLKGGNKKFSPDEAMRIFKKIMSNLKLKDSLEKNVIFKKGLEIRNKNTFLINTADYFLFKFARDGVAGGRG